MQKVEILIDRKPPNRAATNLKTKWRSMSAGLERAKTLIHAKFEGFNINIEQTTSNWKFRQHKSARLTKILKATKRGLLFENS